MSGITEEMLEEFVNGTSEIEHTIEYFGLNLEFTGGGELNVSDGLIEFYAITDDLTIKDIKRLPYDWKKFVEFKGDKKQVQAQAEKLQETLKEYYNENYLDVEYDIDFNLKDSFQRYVANKYEEVDDFDYDTEFIAFIRISENSFDPEDLVQAREEELSNK